MIKTAKKVINKAIEYLGTKEVPVGSNNVKFNTAYYGRAVSGVAYPWCCVFVWYVFQKSGCGSLFYDNKQCAYCPTVENWGRTNKLTVAKNKGKKGDIILFDFGAGRSQHIRLIEKKNADGSYTTIEGNTSITSNDNGGCVMRRIRNQSTVRCIIRPKYDKVVTNKKNNKITKVAKKPKIAKPLLKIGSKGAEVKKLQKDLNFVLNSKLTVDGIFGTKTKETLKKFQKSQKIEIDGIYGNNSYKKMKNKIK